MIHFNVGQRVLCVKDEPETWGEWWYRIRHPSKYQDVKVGEVYTVARIYTDIDGVLMLEIAEVYAPPGFMASRFRPRSGMIARIPEPHEDVGTLARWRAANSEEKDLECPA